MALITYEDKETLIDNPVAEKYKCTADNLNEIKAGINTISNYSTGETIIGTWIDGKPLYRRVVVKDNIGTSGNAGYAYAYIDTLTKMQFIAVTSGVGIIDGNFNDGTNKVILQAYKNSPDIDIWFNSTVSCTKLIITLEYTKTTD